MTSPLPGPIVVVGAGTMGAGIAQIAAAAGEMVLIYDLNPEAGRHALQRISASLEKSVSKGFVSKEERDSTVERLSLIQQPESAAGAAVVIEAVKEDPAVKQAVFRQFEDVISPQAALWTNTSMLSITTLASTLDHPGRFCGVHFFNPVPRMRLVEVIAGSATLPATLEVATVTVAKWGKTPVLAPDRPGFLVNRIFDAIKREALDLLEEGVPPDQLDTAVKLGLNFPMGPCELMDLIGLDTTLDVMINQAAAMGRPIEKTTPLHALVAAGKKGRKSGEGFYSYPSDGLSANSSAG